ncbi:MAG: glycerophosphodiester phosphodiesterase [Clostridiales Family XIII bacterium]|nr:glycerophosphodiester phosphodiesterase [Clostridiales Family XIII bacterium]
MAHNPTAFLTKIAKRRKTAILAVAIVIVATAMPVGLCETHAAAPASTQSTAALGGLSETYATAPGGLSLAHAATPVSTPPSMAKAVKATSSKHIMLIAHRGMPQIAPEHSIEGYRLAVSAGSIFLEQDIRMSKDGVLYVSHSDNVKRVTGKNLTITKTSSKTIDKLTLKNGEKLLRLSELFAEFGNSVYYVIETKASATEKKARKVDGNLVKLIRKYGLESRVMLQSQSVNSLKAVHKKLKGIPCMYITHTVSKKNLIKTIKSLPGFVDIISVTSGKTTEKLRKAIHKRNMKLAVYTVTDERSMKKALSKKPDMIFTNNVQMSITVLSGQSAQ